MGRSRGRTGQEQSRSRSRTGARQEQGKSIFWAISSPCRFSRAGAGAGQEQEYSRRRAGAGKAQEWGRRRVGAEKEQEYGQGRAEAKKKQGRSKNRAGAGQEQEQEPNNSPHTFIGAKKDRIDNSIFFGIGIIETLVDFLVWRSRFHIEKSASAALVF